MVAAQLEEQEKAPFLTVDNAQTAVALTIQVLLGFGFLFLAFLLAIICWKKSAIFSDPFLSTSLPYKDDQ